MRAVQVSFVYVRVCTLWEKDRELFSVYCSIVTGQSFRKMYVCDARILAIDS